MFKFNKIHICMMASFVGTGFMVSIASANEIHNDDVLINEGSPTIKLNDTGGNISGTESDYSISVFNSTASNLGAFSINETSGFAIPNRVFVIESPTVLGTRHDNIKIRPDGDVRFVGDEVVITKDGNGPRLGIGTVAPATTAHFYQKAINPPGNAYTPVDSIITMEAEHDDIPFTTHKWSLEASASSEAFRIRNQTGGSSAGLVMDITGSSGRVRILNELLVQDDVNIDGETDIDGGLNVRDEIAIGVSVPETALHLEKKDAQVLLVDSNSTAATRTILRMVNNGGPNFSFQDPSNGIGWQFAQTANGDMAISKEFSGGSEFIVQGSGRVRMGPGAISNFDLRSNGDLLIPNGSVTANGILLTSSRATKTDISEVNSSDVMEKLKKMEVSEWRYKKADKNDRHISPMAEDFYSLFNLGPSNKHINPNDLASVALIAAQELQKENSELKLDTSDLKTQNIQLNKLLEAQNKRLTSLEKLITNLASSGNSISATGEKVTLNTK